MVEKIQQIRKALECECFLPALSLALTLPDICGQVEYPSEQSSKKRYSKWFDTYATSFWLDDETSIQKFTGELCYQLRCAYLHAGNTDVNFSCKFQLMIGNMFQVTIRPEDSSAETIVLQDIVFLCNNLCNSAEIYYNSTENKEKFHHHNVELREITFILPKVEPIDFTNSTIEEVNKAMEMTFTINSRIKPL